MKTVSEFKDFYYSSYKNEFDLFYQDARKRYLKKLYKLLSIEGILLLIIIASVFLYIYNIFSNYIVLILIVLFVSLLYSFLLLINNIFFLKEKLYIEVNSKLYQDFLLFISDDEYIYEEDTELNIDDFRKMSLFNLKLLNYSGKNFTASSCMDKKFILCDITLFDLIERIKMDSYYNFNEDIKYITNNIYQDKVNIFNGMYYETTINRENSQYIYLIPDNINDKFVRKNLNHYLVYSGKLMKLENLEFEKKYAVYSRDENNSRYILSLSLMEKINKLDKIIPNKKYIVFKEDGRVGIFIDSYGIDYILRTNFKVSNTLSYDYLENFYNKVNNLFEICMIFEDIKSI